MVSKESRPSFQPALRITVDGPVPLQWRWRCAPLTRTRSSVVPDGRVIGDVVVASSTVVTAVVVVAALVAVLVVAADVVGATRCVAAGAVDSAHELRPTATTAAAK